MEQKLYGGIEFGGTKTICALGNANGELVAQTTIPTTSVEETLGGVYEFFKLNRPIVSLGVGAFGPLNLDSNFEEYGSIYNAPKIGWTRVGIKRILEEHCNVPVAIDLDVNCAALGELHFGAGQDVDNFVYLTLGTGIGGSLIINKQVVHGVANLEMGHMRIPHEPFDKSFSGACTFHGDCLEGIASGYALQQRYNQKAEKIADSKVWDLEAAYIGTALANLILTIGPEKFILGGGLIKHEGLIENIRHQVAKNINDYIPYPTPLTSYIVPSSGETNGVLGAIKLATLMK